MLSVCFTCKQEVFSPGCTLPHMTDSMTPSSHKCFQAWLFRVFRDARGRGLAGPVRLARFLVEHVEFSAEKKDWAKEELKIDSARELRGFITSTRMTWTVKAAKQGSSKSAGDSAMPGISRRISGKTLVKAPKGPDKRSCDDHRQDVRQRDSKQRS